MNTEPIKLSTSLFSLALEWNSGAYSLEQLMAKTKEYSVGPGLEIVGFQSLKGYPHLSDKEINEIKSLIEKYGFEPACLGSNLDVALRRDKLLNSDQSVEYLLPQLEIARKLGFPVMRLQFSAKPDVIRKLVPLAEKASIKLGVEIHAPNQVNHSDVLALRELFEEIGSPYLGFVADFGTSMRQIPDALLDSFREVGVTDSLIALTNEIWRKEIPAQAKFSELQERASALGATPPQLGRLNMAFSMNGRQPVEAWKEIVPQTVHLHGKFYGIDESSEEPSIDYEGIIRVFYEGGYKGFLSSEYEGTAFSDRYTGFEQVRRHQLLCSGILKSLEANRTLNENSLRQINMW